MLKISIQSFGDIITNSSSEVYCVYDNRGIEQIKWALNSMLKVLGVDGTADDYVDLQLEMDEDDEYMHDAFNEEYGTFCENKTNEQVLEQFPRFYEDFCSKYCQDEDGRPNFDLKIEAKNEIGETLSSAIWSIIQAFEWVEVYD